MSFNHACAANQHFVKVRFFPLFSSPASALPTHPSACNVPRKFVRCFNCTTSDDFFFYSVTSMLYRRPFPWPSAASSILARHCDPWLALFPSLRPRGDVFDATLVADRDILSDPTVNYVALRVWTCSIMLEDPCMKPIYQQLHVGDTWLVAPTHPTPRTLTSRQDTPKEGPCMKPTSFFTSSFLEVSGIVLHRNVRPGTGGECRTGRLIPY